VDLPAFVLVVHVSDDLFFFFEGLVFVLLLMFV
jgi:hypothetical protein